MARRIQANPPGVAILVWLFPDGSILEIPENQTHFTAVPKPIASSPLVSRGRLERRSMGEVNRLGYFRGAIINDRLYVLLNSSHPVSGRQRSSLREFASRRRLSRGVYFERRRA